jgi:hypothetical protein
MEDQEVRTPEEMALIEKNLREGAKASAAGQFDQWFDRTFPKEKLSRAVRNVWKTRGQAFARNNPTPPEHREVAQTPLGTYARQQKVYEEFQKGLEQRIKERLAEAK